MYRCKYELIIAVPVDFKNATPPVSIPPVDSELDGFLGTPSAIPKTYSTGQLETLQSSGFGVVITDHHIEATVNKSTKGGVPTAEFVIYNPSRRIIDYVNNRQKQDASVIFNVGYEDTGTSLAFAGTIARSYAKLEGVDRKLYLFCTDGAVNVKEGFSNRVFRKGAKVCDVIQQLATEDMKLNLGTFTIYSEYNPTITKNLVINGAARDVIDNLCKTYGLKFWIENSTANLTPKDTGTYLDKVLSQYNPATGKVEPKQLDISKAPPLILPQVPLISSSTGMIGSPELEESQPDQTSSEPTSMKRVRVRTLLMPYLKLGDVVRVEAKYLEGFFKIEGIRISYSHEGEDHTCEFNLESVDGYRVVGRSE